MVQLANYPVAIVDADNTPVVDLDRLADEIAELAAHLDAATYRLLVRLREFDERSGWSGGFRSCAHWLSWRTGMDLGAAREKMRVAHALARLPLLSDAMRCGVLSYSKARALTGVATPENEAELQEIAMHGTAAHIERIVLAWRYLDRVDAAEEQEERRHESRGLSLYIDHDGSYVIRGRLDPEAGALLERALEMAGDSAYRAPGVDRAYLPSSAQRRADALGVVAELALAGVSGARAERFQVVLHVDAATLSGEAGGESELDSGIGVSAETSRRLACDATTVTMTHGSNGDVLDVGRRRRTVPPMMRRALDYRDGGCRFPGCGLRRCDAHHVKHWADGGETSLENLVLLCAFHHRLMHEEGFTMAVNGGDILFREPDGARLAATPLAMPIDYDPVEKLRDDHRCEGILIDEQTAPLWNGDRLDLDFAMMTLR